MSGDLHESFAKLLGRQATPAELMQLHRVKDALGLKDNDAIWLVLMALQDYQSRYEKFPVLIANAASETMSKFKATLDASMQAAGASTKADLLKVIANAAVTVANKTANKQMWIWALACITASIICMAGFGWYMHSMGIKAGIGIGYNQAKDTVAAASWANTLQGQEAYLLAKSGSIDMLVRCNQPGWKVEKNLCYPQAAENGVYGWRIRP